MKPFKTIDEQLEILEKRGLQVNSKSFAKEVLLEEGYYNVINGYKDLFLDCKKTEKYKKGTEFLDVYYLYILDRTLRSTLLEYLLIFETKIKTRIAYRFSEEFPEPHGYLDIKNYTSRSKKTKDVLTLISSMHNTIKKQVNQSNSPVKHHIQNHDGVPLWVLVKYLTIGNTQYLFNLLNEPIRNSIAKDFSIKYNNEYHTSVIVTPDDLDAILKTTNYFRNICAHEDRLYNFKIHKPSKSSKISSIIGVENKLLDRGSLFTMISFLKIVLSKDDYEVLVDLFDHALNLYSKDFVSISLDNILNEMCFPLDWKELLIN